MPGFVYRTVMGDVVSGGGGSDEPTYNAGTQTLIMAENFDAIPDITAMGATPAGSSPRIVPNPSPVASGGAIDTTKNSLVTGRGGTGKAMRLSYSGADQEVVAYFTLNATAPGSVGQYFSYWARVACTTDFSVSTLSVKWFQIWHATVGRAQFDLHHPFPFESPSGKVTIWQMTDSARETATQGCQPVGPYMQDLNNTGWHRYTYQYKRKSNSSATDGIARMWIDGTKVIDVSASAIGVTPPGGEKVWCNLDDVQAINVVDDTIEIHWGEPQTSTTNPWTLDVDDFMWWTD